MYNSIVDQVFGGEIILTDRVLGDYSQGTSVSILLPRLDADKMRKRFQRSRLGRKKKKEESSSQNQS